MNKQTLVSLLFSLLLWQVSAATIPELISPNGTIKAKLSVSERGEPSYQVYYEKTEIISASKLGLTTEGANFSTGLTYIDASEPLEINDSYTLKSGKRSECNYHGIEQTFMFETKDKKKLNIIFRTSNDGIAFRYYFPDASKEVVKISDEASSFKFIEGTKAFISPCADVHTSWCNTNPSYETPYIVDADAGKLESLKAGYIMPATFNYNDIWILLTETAVDGDYCGSRINPTGLDFKITFPNILERTSPLSATYPEAKTPWYTPWRIIAISKGLEGLMESTLETDLATPAKEADFSWVKPGRSSWSWIIEKDNSVNYKTTKNYIDYAADMGWEYCLIDADWDTRIGYEGVKELADYATTKNVDLLVWYNSAGSWNTVKYHPKDLLLFPLNRQREFKRIHEMGIKGIKVDFFCGDGQSMMAYYKEILEDAAKYKLAVNFHGTTTPRGWHRTYPNLVTMESVKGMEFITFDQKVADVQPIHACTLPFTRNIFDPMDFTPVNLTDIPNIKRRTSSAFELALSVVFQSGVQHFATTPKGMSEVPNFVKDFMKNIPGQWEDTQFLGGYPGEYVIIARKAKGKWYIGGINGTKEAKEVTISLPFLDGKKMAEIITDGDTNRTFITTDISLKPTKKTTLKMAPLGGFVISTK